MAVRFVLVHLSCTFVWYRTLYRYYVIKTIDELPKTAVFRRSRASRGFSELSASTRRTPPTVLFASMLATALLATGALLYGKPARCASAGRRMATSAPQMSSAYGFSARDLATGSVTELSVRAACLCQLVPCSLPGG